MRRAVVLVGCLITGSCGSAGLQPVVPDTSRLPPGALGSNGDPDVAAVNLAQWAFADSGRTYGRPIEAARAAAAMDYIAGQLYTGPRWSHISALTKEQLLQGRAEVRDALGIPQTAPSQAVVDELVSAANALVAGNPDAAASALRPPTFSQPGAQVLQRLSNLPYLRMANVATQHAANELFQDNNSGDVSQ